MPPSLRLIVGIVVLGLIVAVASLAVQKRHDEDRLRAAAAALTGGDAKAGVQAIGRYGCGACHVVPGVPRADGATGPSLQGIASRPFLAGRLPNKPEAMIAWIRTPQAIEPGGGMPDMGVTERDARDIAAHLYTLK
jgi:cytochrome c2